MKIPLLALLLASGGCASNPRSIPAEGAAAGALVIGTVVPSKEEIALTTKLVGAIERSDYLAFVADGEAPFNQLKQEQFEAIATKVAPKLRAGYEVIYLGDLKQKGYRVTLWRVSFKNGADDALITLSMNDGKVGGFFIR